MSKQAPPGPTVLSVGARFFVVCFFFSKLVHFRANRTTKGLGNHGRKRGEDWSSAY